MNAWLAILIIALVALLTVTLPAAAEPAGYIAWLDYYQGQGATVVEKWPLLEITTKTGEKIIRYAKIPDTTNTKNQERYAKNTVFLIPDTIDSGESNWRDIMMLLPATIWVGNSEDRKWCDQVYDQQSKSDFPYTPKCAYPMLIYHREGDQYDLDSILHFMQQYTASRVVHVGPMPDEVKKLLAGQTLTETDSLQMPSYWKDSKEVILVKDDYTIAMQAAQYAAFKNAPLAIEGTPLDSNTAYLGKLVTCIGVKRAMCKANLTEEDIKERILMLTSSDKWLIINPKDLMDAYCSNIALITNSNSKLAKTYCHDSLAAPYLAVAKEEFITAVFQEPYIFFDDPIHPIALAYDNLNNRVLVVDGNLILIFDSDFNSDSFSITRFGYEGTGPGGFSTPQDIAIDPKGKILVADTFNNRIQIFDSKGEFIKSFGKKGTGPGEFDYPHGLAIDSQGRILVGSGNHRIDIFDSEGTFIKSFGKEGTGPGEFDSTTDIDIDSKGRILVSDILNKRINIFDSEGTFIKSFEKKDFELNHFSIDSKGRILIEDCFNHRVGIFDSDFNFIKSFGKEGTGPGEFSGISDIITDPKGRILVADTGNGRIQIFDSDGNFLFDTVTKRFNETLTQLLNTPLQTLDYTTYFASPSALIFTSFGFSADYFMTKSLPGKKQYGRIFGITVSDSSSIVARSIFQKSVSSSEKRMLIAVGPDLNTPSYLPELLRTSTGFKTDGYLSAGAMLKDDMPQEIIRGEPKNIPYGTYDILLINVHGFPTSWLGFGTNSQDILHMNLKPAVVLASSCSNLDYNSATLRSNVPIGIAFMRSGAVAYLGLVRPGGVYYSTTGLKEQAFMMIHSEPIGRMMTKPLDSVFNVNYESFFALLGDPTYKPYA